MNRHRIDRWLDGCNRVEECCMAAFGILGAIVGQLLTLPVWLPLMLVRK